MNDLQKLQKRMKALEDTVEKLNKDLAKNATATRKAGKAAATASGNVQRLGIAFRTTFAPITAILGSLALLSKALNTTGQRGADLNVISTSLNGLVDDADAAANALLDVSDKLGKATLFDQEDFTETFKLFTSFRNIGVDSYERVGEAAADIATKLGTGPKEAALQLAKALEDPAKQVTALARSGTVFTEQQKEQIKALQASGDLLGAQEIILKEIEAQYGGAARAAGAAGFAGALDSLGESWRDFLEVLGQSSENSAVGFLNAITAGLDFLKQNFDVVSAAASAAINVIVQPFVALVEGIQQVTGPVDNFREQFRGTLAVITKLLTDITNNVLKPVFKFIGEIIGNIIRLLGGLLQNIGTFTKQAVSAITGALDKIAGAVEAFINSTPAGLLSKLFGIDAGAAAANGIRSFASGIETLSDNVQEYAQDLLDAADAANNLADSQKAVSTTDPFAGAGPKGSINDPDAKSKQSAADKAAIKAEKEYKKALEASLNVGLQKTANLFDQLRTLDDQKAILEAKLNGNEREVRLALEIRDATADLPPEVAKVVEARMRDIDAIEQEIEATEKLNQEMSSSEELARGVADIFANSMKDAVTGLIDGTKSLNDVLSDMLGKLADLFLNMAFSMAGDGLGNLFTDLIKPRAMGGPVNAGEPYLVGEKGPELMVPGASGSVVPNDAFSAAARALTRGAAGDSGSDAQMDAYAAAAGTLTNQTSNSSTYNNTVNQQAFSTATAARMTTNEINRSTSTMNQMREYEERIMNNPTPLKVDYQSTVINNQTYVTEEQFQKGLTQSSNRARQATIRDLRNNPASRKMAGVNK